MVGPASVSAEPWQKISQIAKQALHDSIPAEWRLEPSQLPPPEQRDVTGFPAQCGLLSPLELEITEAYATEIVERVAKGQWRAEDVARGFCKRAAIAQQVVNCLTVTMFDSAIARAKELDEHFARTGKVVGPLHGLPISLKDNFNIPGFPSSVGFCSWALEPMQVESTIVSILRNLGAVLYVKTNVPTAMMIAESVNNCYGRTLNPRNRNLTSGGSSGGESALIAMLGSPLGIGTDIGGSLRIPAACTGIFTLKPSLGRFPHFDARTALAGNEAVASIHGPMARSLADCRLFTDNVCGSAPWLLDPKCLPIPWRNVSLPTDRKLRIGLLTTNDIVTPTPPVQRALQHYATRLAAAGHEVIPFQPVDLHKEALSLLLQFFTADGGASLRAILEPVNEPLRPEMAMYGEATDKGVHALWQTQKQRTALQKAYLDRWNAAGLDVLLGPTSPYVAPRNGQFKTVSYTGVFNILDYSSTSFPSGLTADKDLDVYAPGFVPVNEEDVACRNDYDAAEVHGLPISLQLTAGRLEEEKVVAILEKILQDVR